jgi:hypothetical protein
MINRQNCEQTILGLSPPHFLVLTLMHRPFILWTWSCSPEKNKQIEKI